MFVECTEFSKFNEKLSILNMRNFDQTSINCVLQTYKIIKILRVIVFVKCAKFSAFFKMLCTSNVQNFQHYSKNWILRTYKIIKIL